VRVRGRWAAKCAAFLVLVPALIAVLSWVVMSLWNALIPALFHGPVVSFWQAVGLLVLSKILFGGFRGRGGHHGWHRGRWGREMMRQKWETLTPEERDRLRARFKGRGCWGSYEPPANEPPAPAGDSFAGRSVAGRSVTGEQTKP
jgi:hypothetical protein